MPHSSKQLKIGRDEDTVNDVRNLLYSHRLKRESKTAYPRNNNVKQKCAIKQQKCTTNQLYDKHQMLNWFRCMLQCPANKAIFSILHKFFL